MAKRLEKARGQGQPQWSLTPMTIQMAYTINAGANGQGADWFGPLNPMPPVAPAQVAGRQYDYQPGYNLVTQTRAYEPVSFVTLRNLADGYDLLRTVIETRKDQIERMEWTIKPRQKPGAVISTELKPVDQDRIEAVKEFLQKPDGINSFAQWLRMILEDLFVIDAPALYILRSVGGDLLALQPTDGATIKPLIDDWGRRPTAFEIELDDKGRPTGQLLPPVAYQQVLKGMPAVNLRANDLIYRPRNPRTNRVYGYSPVEQIIMTVNIALRRQLFLLNYYTEGNIPEALITVPEGWTPAQIGEFQTYFDTMLSGDLAARRRLKFIPSGMGGKGGGGGIHQTKEPELKSDFDEWLARVVCFAFSVSPTPFIKQMNRATAGTQKEQSDEEGLGPILQWVKSLIDDILKTELKSADLEFSWTDDTQVDPIDEATILTDYAKSGVLTLNRIRAKLGEPPYDDPMADQPLVLTATGYVPLSAYADAQQRAADSADAQRATAEAIAAGGTGGQDKPAPGGKSGAAASGGKGNDDTAEKHHHHDHRPFTKARKGTAALTPIPFDRKATRVAIADIRHMLGIALTKWKQSAAKQVRKALTARGVQKVDDNDHDEVAREIADELELDGLAALANDIGVDLSDVAEDSINQVIMQMGVTDASDLVNQVNERAVEIAKDRAAEMVGMKWEDGRLVQNPDAEWAITDSTREALRNVISSGLEDNIGVDGIIDNIEALGGFSADRAELIAETEVRRANSLAALEGYKAAASNLGIGMMKEWLLGENPCDICQENADEGPIPLDELFPSGDDAPPGHPNCECALSPVVSEDDVPDGADVEADDTEV